MPLLLDGGGSITFTASVSGALLGSPARPMRVEGGLVGLTRSLVLNYAQYGVRVVRSARRDPDGHVRDVRASPELTKRLIDGAGRPHRAAGGRGEPGRLLACPPGRPSTAPSSPGGRPRPQLTPALPGDPFTIGRFAMPARIANRPYACERGRIRQGVSRGRGLAWRGPGVYVAGMCCQPVLVPLRG